MIEGTCALCATKEQLTRHHLIPKSVYLAHTRTNPKLRQQFDNLIIILCANHHQEVHESFILHAQMQGTIGKLDDKFGRLKYEILKKYLGKKDKPLLLGWKEFLKEFCQSITNKEQEECTNEQ